MPTRIIIDLIFLFYIFHLFYNKRDNKEILQKSEGEEVGKSGAKMFMCMRIHSSFILWH